jgi:Sec7-like guanine-nucleotide exchange factor
VLIAYLNHFEFADVTIDEAFRYHTSNKRQLCFQLYLTGETQMIDRILYQVSRRYWDCNESKQSMFCSIGMYKLKDIVYGILFSTVLLNTDLNTVNIGAKANKKMPLKTFVKNTWDLALTMAEKEDSKINLEEFKKHQKKFESFLKVIYF